MSSTNDPLRWKIIDALKSDDLCTLCSVLFKEEGTIVDQMLTDEQVMDNDIRRRIVDGFGLCPRHYGYILKASRKAGSEDGLGLCLILGSLLESLRDSGKNITHKRTGRRNGIQRVERKTVEKLMCFVERRSCFVCSRMEEMDRINTSTLISMVSERDRLLVKAGNHLCYPHYIMCISKASDGGRHISKALETFCSDFEASISELLDDAGKFVSHHDYTMAGRPMGAEKNVNERAIKTLTGRMELITDTELK